MSCNLIWSFSNRARRLFKHAATSMTEQMFSDHLFLKSASGHWPVMGKGSICRGWQLLLGWLQDKRNHHRGANERHHSNEGNGHGAQAGWSSCKMSWLRVAEDRGSGGVCLCEEIGVTAHWCWRGGVSHVLGTWVFIFLYPQLGLEILNIVVSSACEQGARSSRRGGKKAVETVRQDRTRCVKG